MTSPQTAQFVSQLAQLFKQSTALELDWSAPGVAKSTRFWLKNSTVASAVAGSVDLTAKLPLPDNSAGVVFNFASIDNLEETVIRHWLGEMRRITTDALWIVVLTKPGRNRAWWEQLFFESGFRKHPLAMTVVPYGTAAATEGQLTLILEKTPAPALTQYPLEALAVERSLHMDMLRETGARSDAHLARYQLAAQIIKPGDVVVDLACGLGYGSAMLARQFPGATVIGVDNSEFAIEYARLNFGAVLPNLEFHRANAGDTAWLRGRRVNALVSFETIEHIPDPDGFLRTMTRHMPPDGRFIASVPNQWVDESGKDPNPFHLHVFDLEKFQALVGNHFRSAQVFRQNAERGIKGDHGRILRPLAAGKPTPDDTQNAEWWLIAAEGLQQSKAETPSRNHQALLQTPAKRVRRLCLATCFSPSDSDSWRWLKLYQDTLSEQDFELVVLSCVPSPHRELRTVILPLWMHGYGRAYGVSTEDSTLEDSLISTLTQRDRVWSTQASLPLAEFSEGLSVCQHILGSLLAELQPSALLIWSDILPQSIVLQHLALQRGVPCWTIERGLLPETLMVEMLGQVGQSELNRSFTLSRVMRHTTETSLFAVAQKAYVAAGRTKYAQAKALSPQEFQSQFNPKSLKLVAALLQFDVASNYFPTDNPTAQIHQNGFASSREVIRELAAVAAEIGCLVIAKPHPLDREDYSALENENLRIVREVNLHNLIHASDVVACMASSTQFEALLHEKPILLLARSPLANKGVAYEPQSTSDLPAALRAAIMRQNFEQRMESGRRFTDFLLRYFSVALTETSNAVPTLRDLAVFIARNSIATDCPLDGNERLSRVGAQLNAWETAAKNGLKAKPQSLRHHVPKHTGVAAVKVPVPANLWQADESLRQAGEILTGRGSGVRLVSFDFFDTLICRVCADPGDLFIEAGRQLAAAGLLIRDLTPMEFHSARVAADERARKNVQRQGSLPEIKLADIYAELKNVVVNPAAACAMEFEVERKYCHINPAMVSMLRHVKSLGYPVAVISDTYFTQAQLKQLLSENGCDPGEFDAFFVSCERGKAKWNGQLYQDLLRHFDIHPAELLHIGDNLHADIQAARQFGIQATHYYKTNAQLDLVLKGESNLRGPGRHFAGALNSLRILTSRRAESDQDAFRDGAFVFGPVLSRYADWCVKKFQSANVRTVFALMREGELLGEMVRHAAAAAGVELNIVCCYTSRRATARAAISELSAAGVLELLEGSSMVTLQSIMEVLGLGAEASRIDAETLRKPLQTRENVSEVVRMLFDSPRLRNLIETGCKEDFAMASAYLKELAGESDCIGILDIGWGGSIQRNITRILRRTKPTVRTVGCYLARTRKSGRLILDGDEMHAFMEQDWSRSTILPELAITSPIGSTNGYQRNASGEITPVLGPYEISPAERQVKARQREGVLAFQEFWLALLPGKNYSAETLADIDEQTASIFYRLLEYPTKAEADRLGVLTHDENYFGDNFSAPLCDAETPLRLQRDGIQSIFQAARCYWPQGVVARNNPRLITNLQAGWSDPMALGRLGAWHGLPANGGSFTDDELATLDVLIRSLAPRQIIFAGAINPTWLKTIEDQWLKDEAIANRTPASARLIVATPPGSYTAANESLHRCTFVEGNLAELDTIRSIREKMALDRNIALVLPSDLPESITQALVNGLAPFLGEAGVILTACGRFDRSTVSETLPAGRIINEWLRGNGDELGFELWLGESSQRAALCNWIICQRTQARRVWNNQWTFTATDLAFANESAGLLQEKP